MSIVQVPKKWHLLEALSKLSIFVIEPLPAGVVCAALWALAVLSGLHSCRHPDSSAKTAKSRWGLTGD
jgi:hypothetical protein